MTDELKPHPEDFCEECGLINVIWSAPNKLWNKIARRPDGTDPMLCPTCFIKLVEKDAATGVQNAIDAALIDLIHDLGGLYIHRNGHELYNSAIDDVARFIKGRLGTNPLAEAQARIAELERALAEVRKEAERYRWLRDEDNWGDDTGNRWAILGELTHGDFDNYIDAAMRQEDE